MGAVEKLWYAYIQTSEYQENKEYDYRIPDATQNQMVELLGKANYLKAESMAYDLSVEAEKAGFLQGFRMAMQLREDCKEKTA